MGHTRATFKRGWHALRNEGRGQPADHALRFAQGRATPCFLLLALLLAARGAAAISAEVDPAVLKAEAERIAVMAKVKGTVLAIFSPTGGGGGAGVVISPDGYGVTNFHVAQPSGNAMKCGMADGKVYDAVVVGLDPTGDVAVVKLFGRDDFPFAELADSDELRQGDNVFAMGNPFLLATNFQPTVTYGILSGVHRYQFPAGTFLEYTDCLQTDASINPGNSGGPLFDARGRAIGINGRASFDKRGRVSVGVGYAVSINQVKNFLGCLKSGRIVDHATLGAEVAMSEDRRVTVSDIVETSDAYRRGLRYADEIVSFGGRAIDTPNAFKNVLGIFPKGWRVPLSYRRNGKRYDILVRLTGVHTESELLEHLSARPKPGPMPLPKPGDKPEGPKPSDQKRGDRPDGPKPSDKKPEGRPKHEDGPLPIPEGHPLAPGMPAPPPMPEVVKKHFEEKPGYANYYFNRLNRDRVLKAWKARGDFSSLTKTWTLAGPLDGGGEFQILLDDAGAVLNVPAAQTKWTASDELGSSLLPNGSGGLLPALYLMRRLAIVPPDAYGEVFYLGTAPLAGRRQPADVVVARYGGVECRSYFDPQDGLLLCLEMYPEENADPCEIYFSDYREVEGRQVPGRMKVVHGDEAFGSFKLERITFKK
ncbi:MAG: trypsin-like peptidase domain-containing protein [Thermoguttaceae bacterium]